MIDISLPRHAIYSSFNDKPSACPRCGGELVKKNQTYAVATRQGKRIINSSIMRGDFGWFCVSCPTIVINNNRIEEMFWFQKMDGEYIVLGIIDIDAIAAKKEHLPLGDPDNPLPLIKFTNSPQISIPSHPAKSRKLKESLKSKKKQKRKKR